MVPSIASAILLLLAVCVHPFVLGRWMSLDWHIGDLRPVALLVSAALGLCGLGLAWMRRRAQAWLLRAFPTRREAVLAATTVVLSLCVGLGGLELGLRILGRPFRAEVETSEYRLARFDPELGWAYEPDRTTVQIFGSDRREVSLSFDANGFRVAGPDVRLDPARPSLLIVGGSFAMGHGVPFEESLAGRLAAEPGFPYQVVDLGVQAYGTDQALLALQRHIDRFDTRVVVYPFICDHVVRNSNRDRRLLRPTRRFLGTKPRFALDHQGALFLEQRPERYDDRFRSRLAAVLEIRWESQGPLPSLALTRALVRELQRETETRGGAFVAIHWQMEPPEPYCGDQPLGGLGLRLVDTAVDPPPGWESWVIPGDGHPDARAHAHVARRLIELLSSEGLIGTRRIGTAGGAREQDDSHARR